MFHRILTRQGRIDAHTLARWTHSAFRAYGVPTLAIFHQRLLDRMAYAFRKCSTFNQWLPCSVSPYFDQTESCRRPYSGSVDTQRLSRLRRFLRRLSSISGCWIEFLMPFTGARHSTNGHRAVFHCILPRQSRVDACALARWTHSAFRAYGIPCVGALPLAVTRSNNLCPSLVSDIQSMVTVQCFAAFCPGRVV